MVVPLIPSPYPALLFPLFLLYSLPLYLTYSVTTQKTWLIFENEQAALSLIFWSYIMCKNEIMYLFYRLLKVRWVLKQYLLEHQCGSGKSWSRNCCLAHQDFVLGWLALCMYIAHLDTLYHLLYENLWCYQDRQLLGNNIQWNCKLNVFELEWDYECLLIHSANIFSTSSMCPLRVQWCPLWTQRNERLITKGSFTENFVITLHTWLSLQGAVIDISGA